MSKIRLEQGVTPLPVHLLPPLRRKRRWGATKADDRLPDELPLRFTSGGSL